MLITGLTCMMITLPASATLALEHCLTLDDTKRLACYDAQVKAIQQQRLSASPLAETTITDRPDTGPAADELTLSDAEPPPIAVATILQSLWELNADDKRGTFRVRTYQPNFMLPVHYSSRVNRQPFSPTRSSAELQENYKDLETKLQVSLRAKILQDWLLPEADLWFAYTQTSMWQLWNSEDSAPFRSTDYQPEVLYVIPMADYIGRLPFGWQLQLLKFGFVHQSNGQSEPLSRSWNRVYAAAAFERDQIGLLVKMNKRLSESLSEDDNPDLTQFLGTTELQLSWLPGAASASLTRRMNWQDFSKGSWQLDLTYPLNRQQPDGLRLHLQLFSGYAETLLDYNHRQNSIGLGLMLFNF